MQVPKPRKLQSGAWFIQMRLGGVSVPVTAPTAKECARRAELLKAEHRAGKREFAAKKTTLPLRAAIDAYIDAKRNSLSPATIHGYRIIQNCRFQDYMDRPIAGIKNWQAVYDSEIDRLAPKTLKNSFCFLKTVYQYHMNKPMPAVEMLPVVVHERPYLSAEQIPVFLRAIHGSPWEIGALLALHSLRASELFDLTWKNIDLPHRKIEVAGAIVPDESGAPVHKDANKTAASRRCVPIFIPQLITALEQTAKQEGTLMRYSPKGLRNAINRACKENDLPEVGIHGLRHSFASLAVHLHIPEETAMAIGGWSDFQTMRKIYTHISHRDMQDQITAMQTFFA